MKEHFKTMTIAQLLALEYTVAEKFNHQPEYQIRSWNSTDGYGNEMALSKEIYDSFDTAMHVLRIDETIPNNISREGIRGKGVCICLYANSPDEGAFNGPIAYISDDASAEAYHTVESMVYSYLWTTVQSALGTLDDIYDSVIENAQKKNKEVFTEAEFLSLVDKVETIAAQKTNSENRLSEHMMYQPQLKVEQKETGNKIVVPPSEAAVIPMYSKEDNRGLIGVKELPQEVQDAFSMVDFVVANMGRKLSKSEAFKVGLVARQIGFPLGSPQG